MNGVSLQGLRVFLAVVESGSVSGAGRVLGISQPAVSGHLHSLEKRFGVALLDRNRPIVPTRAGERLAKHARRVLAAARELEEEMVRQRAPGGTLAVGASTTPAETIVPGAVARLAAECPEVSPRVRVGDTEDTLAALLRREVEVALVGQEPEDARLAVRFVEEDRLTAVVRAGDERLPEVTVEELSRASFVLRERGSATRRAVERTLRISGVEPKVAAEIGSNAAVAGAVAAGAGVGVLPERALPKSPGVEPLRVKGLGFTRPLVLVTERGRRLSPAASAFIEVCLDRDGR